MPDFNKIEDTLFVPMLGRIYAGENFPGILNDSKALELKEKLPENLKGQNTQTQYTLMASAVRSTNMDRYIKAFMKREPQGIIVELGCGLETTYYRNDNGKTIWYEVDLPAVINYRRELLGEKERDRFIAADAFSEIWIQTVRKAHPNEPVLVVASGIFYYFEENMVLDLFKKMTGYGHMEIVFDTVNHFGMKQMSKYMKQVGHENTPMYFYVDNAEDIIHKTGGKVLNEEPYYAHTEKKGLDFITSLSMRVSDLFKMVKMVHLKLEK